MKTLTYNIHIKATPEKVLHTMLDKESYKIWTLPFNEAGSWYEGEMTEGSKIHFLGPNSEKPESIGGMVSIVEKYIPGEFISFKHIGEMNDGVEDTESERVQKWAGSHENYTVTEKDGGTDLNIELVVVEEFASYMEETWPKALESLKTLVETI